MHFYFIDCINIYAVYLMFTLCVYFKYGEHILYDILLKNICCIFSAFSCYLDWHTRPLTCMLHSQHPQGLTLLPQLSRTTILPPI